MCACDSRELLSLPVLTYCGQVTTAEGLCCALPDLHMTICALTRFYKDECVNFGCSCTDVHNCQPPVNVAMYFGRSPEIVLQLAPVSVAAIWQTEPTPLQYLLQMANDPVLQLRDRVTKLFQPYYEQLTLRRYALLLWTMHCMLLLA